MSGMEAATPQSKWVLIKPVATAALPEAVQAKLGGLEWVYAVEDEDGRPLALTSEYHLAKIFAKQNDFETKSVH